MTTKYFLESKTVVGIIIMLIPALNAVFDLDLVPEEFEALSEQLTLLVGTVLAIYGRFTATKRLSLTK